MFILDFMVGKEKKPKKAGFVPAQVAHIENRIAVKDALAKQHETQRQQMRNEIRAIHGIERKESTISAISEGLSSLQRSGGDGSNEFGDYDDDDDDNLSLTRSIMSGSLIGIDVCYAI